MGAVLALSLCTGLGLVNLTILRTAIRRGPAPAVMLGIGSSFGDLVYFLLAIQGVSTLNAWVPVRWTLWLAGTAVLLFLAWRSIFEIIHPKAMRLEDGLPDKGGGPFSMLSMGAGLALASPTGVLWWVAIGSSVIASFGGNWKVLWPFAVGFFATAILWSGAFAWTAAKLARAMGVTLLRILSFVSALLFLYFAGAVFISGIRTMH
jgi:L-lysine exporter family protein LysE/ArgO